MAPEEGSVATSAASPLLCPLNFVCGRKTNGQRSKVKGQRSKAANAYALRALFVTYSTLNVQQPETMRKMCAMQRYNA
eukprot:144927-Prorocentrum_minimum.AAC.1